MQVRRIIRRPFTVILAAALGAISRHAHYRGSSRHQPSHARVSLAVR